MIKILFICHGNICRSPMAELLLKSKITQSGLESCISVESAATSTEEIGNPVHPGTREVLNSLGIDCSRKRARQLRKSDYDQFDYLIGMDRYNSRNIMRIVGQDPANKVHCLLEFANREDDIADPWYTGDFQRTYEDICEGLDGLLCQLKEQL